MTRAIICWCGECANGKYEGFGGRVIKCERCLWRYRMPKTTQFRAREDRNADGTMNGWIVEFLDRKQWKPVLYESWPNPIEARRLWDSKAQAEYEIGKLRLPKADFMRRGVVYHSIMEEPDEEQQDA